MSLDKKYIQNMVELLQLEKAKSKLTPCPQTVDPPGHGAVLGPDDHAVYRRCIGILLYISGDRPDAQFITKVLSSRCSAPTTTDMELLRHLVKYLKRTGWSWNHVGRNSVRKKCIPKVGRSCS